MPARERVQEILRAQATRNIDFNCQGVHINEPLFARVEAGIGNLRVTGSDPIINVIVDHALPAGAGAMYDPARNAILVRDDALNQTYDEVAVVHEAVHCAFDIQRRINWRWFGQEAVAYIAGTIYAINKGIPMQTIVSWNPESATSWEIARQLSRGATVTWEQYLPLRNLLLANANNPHSVYYHYNRDYANNGA